MSDKQESTLTIEATPEMRIGRHASVTTISTRGDDTRLDFSDIEDQTEDGNMRGILVSRVYMTTENARSLRDLLNRHFDQLDANVNA